MRLCGLFRRVRAEEIAQRVQELRHVLFLDRIRAEELVEHGGGLGFRRLGFRCRGFRCRGFRRFAFGEGRGAQGQEH